MEQQQHSAFPAPAWRAMTLKIVLLALLYYGAASSGLLLAFEHSNATPVWPPSGIAFGALLLGGWRLWPAILLGAFSANVAAFTGNGLPADARVLLVSLIIAAGNTAEALAGSWLYQRLAGPQRQLDTLQNVYKFAAVGAVMCVIAATCGTATLVLSGLVPAAALWTVGSTWWVGDTAGIILVTPLLLAWREVRHWRPQWRSAREPLAALLLLALLIALVFGRRYSAEDGMQWLAYLLIVCIGWSSYCYGQRGTTLACVLVNGAAVLSTIHGRGPFVSGTLNDALIALESFIVLCSLVGLVLCADVSERRHHQPRPGALARLSGQWLTLFCCLGLTVLMWYLVNASTERRAREQFDVYATNVEQRLQKRLTLYEANLRSAQALFKIGGVSRAQWHDFVDALGMQQYFPGAEGLGYAALVTPATRAAYEQRVRTEGYPQFRIHPDAVRASMAVVTYIEPFAGRNLRAFGYDMSSEPVRRTALEQAARSGQATLSGKVTLVQEDGEQPQAGFLISLPLYAPDAPLATPAQRLRALQGYVYGAFRSKVLIHGVLGATDTQAQLEIYDGDDIGTDNLLYASGVRSDEEQRQYPNPFIRRSTLDLDGHRWNLRFTSLAGFENAIDRQKSQIILIAGTIISLLFFGVVRALTARQEYAMAVAEDMTYALRHSERRFEWLVNAASEFAIIATDLVGNIQVFSAGAERMLGYGAAEMVGLRTPADLLLPQELAARCAQQSRKLGRPVHALQALTGGVQLGQARSQEWTYMRKDGAQVPVNVVATATADAEGRVTGYLLIAKDIRHERELQRSLLAAKEQAEAASQAKSDFVANMSHEIRTPMNAVLGMAHLLASTELHPDQHKYLDMIRQSGQSLMSILNDVLDFSKIEAGRMELAPAPFRLGDVLDAIAAIMTVNAGEKDLELAIGVAPQVPQALLGDALRLQQALVNLVGNAIKFTERGAVSVRVDCSSRADSADASALALRFVVRDSGIGMDQQQLERLFMPFSQADASMTRRFGGTGLGLTISRRIVELMGGSIAVASTPGSGSSFTLTVPLQRAAAQPDEAPLAGWHVLVADDDADSLACICDTIRAGGGSADAAHGGPAALELWRAGRAAGRHYDAVLCDWQMAELDGIAVLRAMHADAGADALPPLLIMANAFGRGKLMVSGAAHEAAAIVLKPVTVAALAQVLRAVPASASQAPARRIDGLRILLVEDHPINQIVATGMLEQVGAHITVADNGQVAVDLLRSRAGDFDMVLMDVQMPVMDGYQATRVIRDELQLRLPVLAMSAGVLLSEREECIASGMDDFIPKPVEMDQMMAAIGRHVRGSGTPAAQAVRAALAGQH